VRIYSGRDSNVTSRASAASLQNDTAMISVANRVIAVGYITLSFPCGEKKRENPQPMNYWEIIVNKIIKAGFSVGWVSALDDDGRTVWIVDAHRGDGKRFIVRADEKLSAFIELERQVLTVTFYLESIKAET